ncbi:alanine racemase [Megalodesulfovibrio paquesii]
MARILADMQILRGNLRALAARCQALGVTLLPVLKGVDAWLPLARLCQEEGLGQVAVSTANQAARLVEAGLPRPVMLDLPPLSHCREPARFARCSCVSGPETARALAAHARDMQLRHEVLLMIDLGDVREGCRPDEALALAGDIRALAHPWFGLRGLATNFGCLNTAPPSAQCLSLLTELACAIGRREGEPGVVSVGGSILLPWLAGHCLPACITELRVGMALLLGHFLGQDCCVPDLRQGGFLLAAEVLEARRKEGRRRIILDLGVLSVVPELLDPPEPGMRCVGASSDYLVYDVEDCPRQFAVGDEVRLLPKYDALARAFHSPSVKKPYNVEGGRPDGGGGS